MFEGFGSGPAPWAEGGEVTIEPGGVSGQVAFSRPYLVDASSYELRKAHEGMWGQGGGE